MLNKTRKILLLSLFVTPISFAQVDPQISVKEFKNLRDEARSMIKGFELTKDIGSVGAPDYKFIREKMRTILDRKPEELEAFLVRFNDDIADDYNIIQSVKDLGKSKAIKQTADIARNRFEEKARGYSNSYQSALLSFVEKDLVGLEKECVTVLCVNQVREDLKAWFKQAKKMNKPLKLDGVTLPRSNKVNPSTASHIKTAAHPSIISGKPIAFQRDSKEYATLTDPLIKPSDVVQFSLKDILAKGILNLKREVEICYEIRNYRDYSLNVTTSKPVLRRQNALPAHIKFERESVRFNDSRGTLTTKHTVKAPPLYLNNKNIAISTGKGFYGEFIIFDNNKNTVRSHELEYGSVNTPAQADDGVIAVGDDEGNVYFFDENGNSLGRERVRGAIRKQIEVRGNEFTVETVTGEKKTFTKFLPRGFEDFNFVQSDGSKVRTQTGKVIFSDQSGKTKSQATLTGQITGKPYMLKNDVLIIPFMDGTVSLYNKDGIKVSSQKLEAEVHEISETSSGEAVLKLRNGSTTYLKDIHGDGKVASIVVKIPCTDEQLIDPSLPRRKEATATQI